MTLFMFVEIEKSARSPGGSRGLDPDKEPILTALL